MIPELCAEIERLKNIVYYQNQEIAFLRQVNNACEYAEQVNDTIEAIMEAERIANRGGR